MFLLRTFVIYFYFYTRFIALVEQNTVFIITIYLTLVILVKLKKIISYLRQMPLFSFRIPYSNTRQ